MQEWANIKRPYICRMASYRVLLRRQQHGSNYAGRNQTTFNDIRGGIKSAQRGYWGDSLNTDTAKTKYIEINAVDPEKCELFAVVGGNEGGTSGAQYMRNPRIGLTLETNRIAVTNNGSDFCSISVDWQIIEHY